MKITIETLKPFTSEYKGQKQEKYFVEFDGGKKGYAYKGKWNQGWKESDEVEAEVIQSPRPDKEGNTVFNLKCPAHLNTGFRNKDSMSEEIAQTLRFLKKDIVEELQSAKREIQAILEAQAQQLQDALIAFNGGKPTAAMQDKNAQLAKKAREEVCGSKPSPSQQEFDEMNPPPLTDDDMPF